MAKAAAAGGRDAAPARDPEIEAKLEKLRNPSVFWQTARMMIPMAITWYMMPDPMPVAVHIPKPWLQGRSWPWLAPQWKAEQLDPAGLAYRLPNFLSEEEMVHLLTVVRPQLNFSTDMGTTYETAMMAGAGLAEPPSTKRHQDAARYVEHWSPNEIADDVLLRIERRIGTITGIPFHDWETPLQLSHGRAKAGGGGRTRPSYLPSGNLHHDFNQRPNRTVSLIIYLSGGAAGPADCEAPTAAATSGFGDRDGSEGADEFEELVGGETVFPCVRSWPADDPALIPGPDHKLSAAKVAEACERLEGHFTRGTRYIGHPLHELDQPNESADEAAARLTSDLCVTSKAPDVLRVRPRRGDALLFLNVGRACPIVAPPHPCPPPSPPRCLVPSACRRPPLPALAPVQVDPEGGEALPQMWHAGCQVERGHKWTLREGSPTLPTDPYRPLPTLTDPYRPLPTLTDPYHSYHSRRPYRTVPTNPYHSYHSRRPYRPLPRPVAMFSHALATSFAPPLRPAFWIPACTSEPFTDTTPVAVAQRAEKFKEAVEEAEN